MEDGRISREGGKVNFITKDQRKNADKSQSFGGET
jgi:hypothetical protein